MSLRNRQQQNRQQQQDGPVYTGGIGTVQAPPVQLVSGREYFSVVDGEIVNVIGTTDIPGMSLAWLCQSDEDGQCRADFA